MKIAASNPAEQRRQLMLLGLLVVVAVIVWYTQFGGGATEATPAASNPPAAATSSAGQAAAAGRGQASGGLPEPLRLADLEPVPEQVTGARNPFGFGSRPEPPRPAAPPPAPAPPPRPAPQQPVGPPPLPPIPVKFLGFVEDPSRPGKVVSLAIGGSVVIAREGELIDGRYRLVKIGLDSIVMAYPDGRGQQTFRMSGG